MAEITKFPHTNQELAELGHGKAVRFTGTEAEYWALAREAEFRVDFFKGELIATMGYESDVHSDIANELMFILQSIFRNEPVRFGNSNRPVCIPDCGNAIFNPDGSVIQLPDSQYEYRPGITAELTPLVLFEVLSSTTRLRDWGEKLPCYKRIPSLQQILYVDSEQVRVVIMERLPGDGGWLERALEQPDEAFTVAGQAVTLRAIYDATLLKG